MPESMLGALINILYPAHCLICSCLLADRSETSVLCKRCFDRISFNLPGFCQKCGLGGQIQQEDNCPACKGRDLNFRKAFSACVYEEPIKTLIHLFKYNSKLKLRKLFAAILIRFVKTYKIALSDYDLFVAVPMHPVRLREREFNHSQILSQDLSAEFKVPISYDNIIRSRHSAPQMRLNLKERSLNVSGAFKIKRPEEFANKNILIIDDVFTTGSTASEISLLLKENNASRIDVLTLARSVRKGLDYESN